MPPVHFPSFRLPSISLPSFADIKAKFTAFKGHVISALQSLGRRTATPVQPIQTRQVANVPTPVPSTLQELKKGSANDIKQNLIAQRQNFEAKVHKNDTTVAALPKALTQSAEFKSLMAEIGQTLAARGKWDVKSMYLTQKYGPQLNELLGKSAPVGTKLALTLDDGRKFIESLKQPILENTPTESKSAVEGGFKKLLDTGTWQKMYDNATKNLGWKAEGFDGNEEPTGATITFGDNQYKFAKALGSGNFGSVYLFKKNPDDSNEPGIVVKRPQGGDPQDHKTMIESPAAEGRSMANAIGTGAAAENILPMRGAIRTSNGELLLVLGMAKHGSLTEAKDNINVLNENNQTDWAKTAELKLTPMVDLAKGLERLQLAKGQAHLDVATRNLLIKENGSTVLADFGMADEVEGEKIADAKLGAPKSPNMPIRWTAPERLKGESSTTAADTWSFGMTLYEIVYGKIPFQGQTNREVIDKVTAPDFDPDKELPEISKEKWPNGLDAQLRDLLVKTLQPDPKNRPSMDEIQKHPALNNGITGTPKAKQLLASTLSGNAVHSDDVQADEPSQYNDVDNVDAADSNAAAERPYGVTFSVPDQIPEFGQPEIQSENEERDQSVGEEPLYGNGQPERAYGVPFRVDDGVHGNNGVADPNQAQPEQEEDLYQNVDAPRPNAANRPERPYGVPIPASEVENIQQGVAPVPPPINPDNNNN